MRETTGMTEMTETTGMQGMTWTTGTMEMTEEDLGTEGLGEGKI
jgi:hypothetical protein